MSTRAQVRFATREVGVSFDKHPEKIHAQFYVNSDGYPEGLGLDIAESITMNNNPILQWEIESLTAKHGDLEYIYYIWQAYDKGTWISIFETRPFEDLVGKCIFVGKPNKLIAKYGSQLDKSHYKLNTNKRG